jgi:hypothetical protein
MCCEVLLSNVFIAAIDKIRKARLKEYHVWGLGGHPRTFEERHCPLDRSNSIA